MRQVHSWLNPKIALRTAGGGNYRGLFAKAAINEGELLLILGGHVITIGEEPIFSDGTKDLALQINERFVIGTKYEHEIEDTDFVNHSCNPNAGIKGQIFLVAMRSIAIDEEITFDYAMVLHKPEGLKTEYEEGFECQCGSRNCRGRVTYNDWKIPELQARYHGFFSQYLQEKIEKLKVFDGSKRATT
jgi:hypothetical protein